MTYRAMKGTPETGGQPYIECDGACVCYGKKGELAALRGIAAKLNSHAKLLAACERVHDWLSSFSMPPTSTIQEKQEHMAILDAALAAARA